MQHNRNRFATVHLKFCNKKRGLSLSFNKLCDKCCWIFLSAGTAFIVVNPNEIIIGMDNMNMKNIARMLGEDTDGKIKMLLDYCGGGEVDDPWYTGRFKEAYECIYKGCKALFEELTARS